MAYMNNRLSMCKIKNCFKVILPVLLVMNAVVQAQTLQSLETVNMQDGSSQLRYHFDRTVGVPSHFVIEGKKLIVLDFKANGVLNGQKTKKIDNGTISTINNIVNRNQVRSTISTESLTDYTISSSDKTVVVNLKRRGNEGVKPVWNNAVASNHEPLTTDVKQMKDVSFYRNSQGAGVVDIYLPSAKASVNVSDEKNKGLSLSVAGHVWEAAQNRRIEVTDFATPVSALEVVNIAGVAHVNVLTQASYEYSAQQIGSKYQLIIKPKVLAKKGEALAGKMGVYTGELISINFQDIDVRAVLQIIADFTGLNIVVSDTVSSRITIRLQNVPWDQALDVVLQSKTLTKQQVGNVVFIMPLSEYKSTPKELITEIIQLNNAKANDIVKVIADGKSASSSGGQAHTAPGLSEFGSINTDPHQNLLIVRDTFEQILILKELIKELDKPLRQVTISAQIVIANDNYARELGVKWGGGMSNRGMNVQGKGDDAHYTHWGNPGAMWKGGNDGVITHPSSGRDIWGGTAIDLAAVSQTSGLAISILRKTFSANLELSAMQQNGKGEILSSPTLTTTDRNTAYIKQGTEVPFETVSDSGTQTEFKDVVMELNVTPHITPDDRVVLEILVKKDEIGKTDAKGNPTITKREIKTEAIVNDGETVVLGGIYEHTVSQEDKKVPFFGDLPFISPLFKNKARTNEKLEMIIFLTPTILKN